MIYITGDTHGEHGRFLGDIMPGEKTWGKDDYLIICGDFGYVFNGLPKENKFLDNLSARPYTILFVDGNHENFDLLYQYPVEDWKGGKIHKVRDNIFHLMRGQVFDIEGKKIFTMGGAYSTDKHMRHEGLSWWPQEMPNDSEYKEAIKNLKAHNHAVDYIISHTAPENVMLSSHSPRCVNEHVLNNFFEWIRESTSYKRWYFGHLHMDKDLWFNQTALWFAVRIIGGDKDETE